MEWEMLSTHELSHKAGHATSDSQRDSEPSSPCQRSASTYEAFHKYPSMPRKATQATFHYVFCCSFCLYPSFASRPGRMQFAPLFYHREHSNDTIRNLVMIRHYPLKSFLASKIG